MTRWGDEEFPDWHPDPMRPFSGGDYPDIEEGIPAVVFVQRMWFALKDGPDREDRLLKELNRNGERFTKEYLANGVRGIRPPPGVVLQLANGKLARVTVTLETFDFDVPKRRTRSVASLTFSLRALAHVVPKKDRAMIEDAAHDLGSKLRDLEAHGVGTARLTLDALVETVRVALPYAVDFAYYVLRRVLPLIAWALRR